MAWSEGWRPLGAGLHLQNEPSELCKISHDDSTINIVMVIIIIILLHCVLAVAQCTVISPVCGFVCVCGVCYHDNLKLCASILTKLGL